MGFVHHLSCLRVLNAIDSDYAPGHFIVFACWAVNVNRDAPVGEEQFVVCREHLMPVHSAAFLYLLNNASGIAYFPVFMSVPILFLTFALRWTTRVSLEI